MYVYYIAYMCCNKKVWSKVWTKNTPNKMPIPGIAKTVLLPACTVSLLPILKVCARWKVPAKCFKICHILYMYIKTQSYFGFLYIYINYGKFWSVSLELFVEHKLRNWEEWKSLCGLWNHHFVANWRRTAEGGGIPIKNGMPLKFIIFDKVSVKRWATPP